MWITTFTVHLASRAVSHVAHFSLLRRFHNALDAWYRVRAPSGQVRRLPLQSRRDPVMPPPGMTDTTSVSFPSVPSGPPLGTTLLSGGRTRT